MNKKKKKTVVVKMCHTNVLYYRIISWWYEISYLILFRRFGGVKFRNFRIKWMLIWFFFFLAIRKLLRNRMRVIPQKKKKKPVWADKYLDKWHYLVVVSTKGVF